MKFNQLADKADENFEVAQAVNFADLAKQAQLQTQFSQCKKNKTTILINYFLTETNLHFAVLIVVI